MVFFPGATAVETEQLRWTFYWQRQEKTIPGITMEALRVASKVNISSYPHHNYTTAECSLTLQRTSVHLRRAD